MKEPLGKLVRIIGGGTLGETTLLNRDVNIGDIALVIRQRTCSGTVIPLRGRDLLVASNVDLLLPTGKISMYWGLNDYTANKILEFVE